LQIGETNDFTDDGVTFFKTIFSVLSEFTRLESNFFFIGKPSIVFEMVAAAKFIIAVTFSNNF